MLSPDGKYSPDQMAKMKKKTAGVQGIEVKTHCAASTQEAGVNPDVRLGAAAESSTLQKKKVSFLVSRMGV